MSGRTRGLASLPRLLVRALGLASTALLLLAEPIGAAWAQDGTGNPRTGTATPSRRVVTNVTVRAGPTTRSAVLGRLLPGERAEVTSVAPGWIEIRLADGRTGWVSRRWIVIVATPAATAEGGRRFVLEAVDVGTGLAILVTGPDFTLLYDGGSNDDTAQGEDNRLVDYLRAVHPELTRIDQLILSHPHRDHVELLADVLARYEVGSVWDSGRVNPICGYRAFVQTIATRPSIAYHDAIAGEGPDHLAAFPEQTCRGARLPAATVTITGVRPIVAGEAVALGEDATMTVMAADGRPVPDVNANSVVVMLRLGSRSVLLMGDAEAGGRHDPSSAPDPDSIEGRLLACCRAALTADVMVAGHHGSRTSSRAAFVDAVGARDFVISAGPTRYATVTLPDADIVAELQGRGRLWRTDRDDNACAVASVKVGRDADGQPGGCDNVRLTITDAGVTGEYLTVQPQW